MEVILREEIEKLGNRGDVVKVANGYARNFLLPRRMAVAATESNKKIVEQEREAHLRREAKTIAEAQERAKLMSSIVVTIHQRAGEGDHLFGSVTAQDIVNALEKMGHHLERKQIHLDEVIKTLGEHKFHVRLHREVSLELPVNVVKEEE
jgi:large subunit ribosomal protein L9